MGLINTPAMFMQTMNNLFSNMLDFGMVVFLDDILVYLCYSEGTIHMLLKKVLVLLMSVYILLQA